MKKTWKAFKFEVYKNMKNKLLMFSFFIFFLLFLAIIIGYPYMFAFPNSSSEISQQEREQEFANYHVERERYALLYEYASGDKPIPDGVVIVQDGKTMYKEQYDYYDYLIKSETLASDYLPTTEQGFDKKHRGSYVMIEILDVIGIALPILALVISGFVIGGDYTRDKVKLLLASQLGRKNIFFGKTMFILSLNLLLFTLAIACPMGVGISDMSGQLLLYGKSGYYAQSLFAYIFPPKALSMLISMTLSSAIAIICGQVFRKKSWNMLLTISVFILAQLLYVLLDSVGINYQTLAIIMPLAFLRYADLHLVTDVYSQFGTGWLPLIIVSVTAIVAMIASSFIGARINEKKEF